MAVTRHEARGNAREPNGGNDGTREAFVRNLFISLGQVNAGRVQIGGRSETISEEIAFKRKYSGVYSS